MLCSLSQIRSEGNLPAAIKDDKLIPHQESASIFVRNLLTDAVYDNIKTDPDEIKNRPFLECSKAEALIAMSIAVVPLNIETQGTGIVRTKGWDQSRSDLMSQTELDSLSEKFRERGLQLLNKYIPKDETPGKLPNDNDNIIPLGNGGVLIAI